ncbi:MAG TPA: transcription antitermination factor NusB [Planctomycetaceae bacterium]|nr:transcription antitermination factor NusB [Planctomycetaceae bacterium]
MPRPASPEPRSPAASPLPHGARDLAFQVLDEYKRQGTFVRAALDERARAALIAPADRALAVELAFGVVRRQSTLNTILQAHVRRPRHNIEGALWTLLQIGAYQVVFLESMPRHAAVDETVETAKRLGRRRWAGFLNGTLRSVAASVSDELLDHPAADAVPLAAGRFRRSDRPLFADPGREPADYFARAFSFPDWLVARWAGRFDFEELVRLGFWFNAPQAHYLRVNRLLTSRDDLLAALAQAGVDARPGELPESIRLESSRNIERLPGFDAGWFSVQDETAMRAAVLLDPQPGMHVLDLCAAPGTKAAHLAERMANQGRIIAADVNPQRRGQIDETARRLRLDMIEPRAIHADGSNLPEGPFDAALVDVPCSNTGVLGKRPEARWRIGPRDLDELPRLQQRLLLDACRRVKAGGRVAYSTCSIEPEENERVVQAVVSRQAGIVLSDEVQYAPGRPADGGYQALLERRAGQAS